MALLSRKILVALKKETIYGTPETLAGTDCMLVTTDPSRLTALAGNTAARDFARPYLGNSSTIQVEAYRQLSFDIELAGSGTAGTRPAYGDALLMCGLAETVSAGSKVEYEPVSTGFDAATMATNLDGVNFTLVGARSNLSVNLARGQLPKLTFDAMGRYAAPTDTAALVPDFSGFKVPVAASSVNTPTVTLFGESLCMESFQLDLGNQIVFRDLPGCSAAVELTQRAVTGTIVFQMTTVADYNWVEAAKTKTSGALQIIHGTAAGNIIQIDGAQVTLNPPSFSDSDGIVMCSIPLVFEPTSAGNDELVLTFK